MFQIKYSLSLLCLLIYNFGFSQNIVSEKYTVDQVIQLALNNHQKLKISRKSIDIAKQQTAINKLNRLPDVSFNANAMYLGDIIILDPEFVKQFTVDMPHFGNTFSLQAQQLIYKGDAVNNSIKIGDLQEQLARLNLENDEINIKFLVVSNYLNLYKLYNQKKVFIENIKLAEKRIENVNSFYKQGMVTRNEVIRGDLLLASLKQAVVTLNNNISILNNQLVVALGLSENIVIIPDEEILKLSINLDNYEGYKKFAINNHPLVRTIQLQKELSETVLDITKSNKKPILAGFGSYNMQRPLTNSFPIVDVYNNNWQVGLSLTYNIESLFKNSKKESLDKLKIAQVKELKTLTEQNLQIATKAAYLKYNEALSQNTTFYESKRLADENYKIIEKKYLNQLAIITEMLDASNTKLEAGLQYINSEINIIYAYYNLLKSTGKL